MGEFISVVLLPGDADTASLCQLSAQFKNSRVYLDGSNLPHITVAQFEAPVTETARLWEEVKSFATTVNMALSAGISFVPSIDQNETWIEMQFLKSEALRSLQNQVLSGNFAKMYRIHNGNGDNYRPHITVGLIEGQKTVNMSLGDFSNLFKREFGLRLAVGPNGDNFTFALEQFSQNEDH